MMDGGVYLPSILEIFGPLIWWSGGWRFCAPQFVERPLGSESMIFVPEARPQNIH